MLQTRQRLYEWKNLQVNANRKSVHPAKDLQKSFGTPSTVGDVSAVETTNKETGRVDKIMHDRKTAFDNELGNTCFRTPLNESNGNSNETLYSLVGLKVSQMVTGKLGAIGTNWWWWNKWATIFHHKRICSQTQRITRHPRWASVHLLIPIQRDSLLMCIWVALEGVQVPQMHKTMPLWGQDLT